MLASKSVFLKIELSLQRGLDFLGFGARSWEQKSIKNRSCSWDLSRNASKMPQDAPKMLQDAPRRPKDGPRSPRGRPRTAPRRPQTPQDSSKTAPRGARMRPRGAQIREKTRHKRDPKRHPLQISFLEPFGADFGRFSDGFGKVLGMILEAWRSIFQ